MTSPSPPSTPSPCRSKHQSSPSPPPSPLFSFDDELPVTPTDDWGMVLEDAHTSAVDGASRVRAVKATRPRRPRRKITYVSRHFSQDTSEIDLGTSKPSDTNNVTNTTQDHNSSSPATPPRTPAKAKERPPRIYYGLNVDDLSSDSSLSSIPYDIGPDPFSPSLELLAIKSKKPKSGKHPTKSPYFPSPHKLRPHFLSTLPFPPLSADKFGLMQERLAHDPFRLLVATIFLNKTPGERAMPIFYTLMETYPNPAALAEAKVQDVTAIIRELGFQNQRARKVVGLAKGWTMHPPEECKRYKKLNYPEKGDGRTIKKGEILGPEEEDERVAWEISHLPGLGPYSHDSWRMFCRDTLLKRAEGWNGESSEGRGDAEFEPEWKRVLPLDKELRAWMTWMWLKEGWVWNKETGKKTKASEELMEMARGGGVLVEEREKDVLTLQHRDEDRIDLKKEKVNRLAGEVLESLDDGILDHVKLGDG